MMHFFKIARELNHLKERYSFEFYKIKNSSYTEIAQKIFNYKNSFKVEDYPARKDEKPKLLTILRKVNFKLANQPTYVKHKILRLPNEYAIYSQKEHEVDPGNDLSPVRFVVGNKGMVVPNSTSLLSLPPPKKKKGELDDMVHPVICFCL